MSEVLFRSRDGWMLIFRIIRLHHDPDPPGYPAPIDFEVEIATEQFTGRSVASTYLVGSPSTLFRRMAESWRGWTGTLKWEDMDHHVLLTASSDRTGHIQLVAELRDRLYQCRLSVPFVFEAGQLDAMARQVQGAFG